MARVTRMSQALVATRSGDDGGMAWSTAFTELFSVRYPIALAPMGGTAGGALTAAGSNGGGLGRRGRGPGLAGTGAAHRGRGHQRAVGRRLPELGRRPGHARAGAEPAPARGDAVLR